MYEEQPVYALTAFALAAAWVLNPALTRLARACLSAFEYRGPALSEAWEQKRPRRHSAVLSARVPSLPWAFAADDAAVRVRVDMRTECPAACNACETAKGKMCARPPGTPAAVEPGSIEKSMRRILDEFPQYSPRALSQPGDGNPRVKPGSAAPWILTLRDFLSDEEVQSFLDGCASHFERSLAGDQISPVRTSKQCWCAAPNACGRSAVTARVEERVRDLLSIPTIEHFEPFQVLKYEPGQFYKVRRAPVRIRMRLVCVRMRRVCVRMRALCACACALCACVCALCACACALCACARALALCACACAVCTWRVCVCRCSVCVNVHVCAHGRICLRLSIGATGLTQPLIACSLGRCAGAPRPEFGLVHSAGRPG